MDELEISGRRYLSSVRAAKEYKYHSDYIGQLVRGGKVVGQKVGRSWYVDADSLAEYLGKEVAPRGPVAKKDEPVIAEKVIEQVAEKPLAMAPKTEDDNETPFIMPLRKTGRSHVIASIGNTPVAKEVQKVEPIFEPAPAPAPAPAPVIKEEIIAEPAPVVEEEEENFIPLKITSESTRNIYAEPEDSFYKVSRKGLRYVSAATPASQKVFAEGKSYAEPRTKQQARASANSVARALSVVLVAGILSLGVGVLMSYYLHSTTTVQDSSQTSSVILSN